MGSEKFYNTYFFENMVFQIYLKMKAFFPFRIYYKCGYEYSRARTRTENLLIFNLRFTRNISL